MKVYLSIDLDYWRAERSAKAATRFFKKLFGELDLPIMTALHHHHLIPHTNSFDVDTVINIDAHSDISDRGEKMTLDEGNWVNFVEGRKRSTYVWRYPRNSCLTHHSGYCHHGLNPFETDCTEWARVKKTRGLARIPWSNVVGVGVCLSPEWLDENQEVVSYPIEALDFLELCGKWWVYGGRFRVNKASMEKGTGIFAPRLIKGKKNGIRM